MSTSSAEDGVFLDAIAAERGELAELLRGLSPESWEQPTLCAGWRVREVVAHMTMPFRYSTRRFVMELLKDRGKFDRMAGRCAHRDAAMSTGDLTSALADNARNPWKPPGGGFEGALTHDVIHGLDITVALGLSRTVPRDRFEMVLGALAKPKSFQHFGTDLDGIALQADDMAWTFGSGTPIVGRAQDLALVMCGRRLPAGLLQGEASTRFVEV